MVRKPPGRRISSSDQSHDDPTTVWARDAVSGRIVVGEIVAAAAERHLRDLKDGPSRGLHWRPEIAARAFAFPPAVLSITEGAKQGEPFNLLNWHTFCAGNIFGWRYGHGRMRFRRGWIETGKGQAKSPFMAAIGLYMMGWYGVPRAKVYALGEDKATANVLFKDAAAMCRANIPGADEDEVDTLESREEVILRGEGDNVWKIEHPTSGSIFQPLAKGTAPSGPRPIAVLVDEIHELSTNHVIEVWQAALAKMPGDAIMLLGTNTPATTQIVGTQYSDFFQDVARGKITDDEAFAFVARVDKKDRETVFDNEACWPKALPALGVTYPVENIRGEVATAKVLLSKALSIKRLFFGIPLGAVEFWIAEDAWAAVQGAFNVSLLKKAPCWLALDLSDKNDLTALTAVWIGPDGRLYAKTWYWTTREGLHERALADGAPYEEWAEDPATGLTATPGAVIDKTFVAAKVKELCETFAVEFLAFDPAGMADFIAACEDIGFPVWRYQGDDKPSGKGLALVSHAQGTRARFEDKQLSMPRSVEKLEDVILKGDIVIEASPVTYSCAANAALDSDGQNNRAFDKKRSRGRIDGIVTIAMGVGAAKSDLKIKKRGSYLESSPLLVL